MKKLWALATHKTDEAVWMCRLMSFSLAHVSFVGFVVPWSDFLLRPNGRRKTICLHVLVDLKEILPSQELMFMKTSSSRRRWLFFRKQMGYLHSVLYEVLLGLWSAKVHLLPNMQLQESPYLTGLRLLATNCKQHSRGSFQNVSKRLRVFSVSSHESHVAGICDFF